MKKSVISIPVHTQPVVVENQIQNILKFFPNSSVVLHVSADGPPGFWNSLLELQKKYDGFLFLNPTRYHTFAENEAANVTGLSTVHASNFAFMDSVVKFDTFAIDTSNDFFVRKGIEKTIENFSCGFSTRKEDPSLVRWQSSVATLKKHMTVTWSEKGSQEGSFYPSEVFREVAKKINKISAFLNAEEFYLPTIAFNLFPELYEQNSGTHYVFHDASHQFVTNQDISKVREGKLEHCFSVKRVPRDMNHPCRVYVNNLTKND